MSKKKSNKNIFHQNVIPNKNLGQNFLKDEFSINKIIESVNISPEDIIIEIGPGLGALTDKLTNSCKRLYLIELDKYLYEKIKDKYKENSKVIVLYEDALALNYTDLIKENLNSGAKIKIVSNLPYYITTEIITKLIGEDYTFDLMVFTIQREAAQKIVAMPKEKTYTTISAFAQCYYKVDIIHTITPDKFVPPPTVDSAVIVFKKLKQVDEYKLSAKKLLIVIKACFSQRRKTIYNSLSSSGIVIGGKEKVSEYLEKANIAQSSRAQELGIQQFVKLAELIYKVSN